MATRNTSKIKDKRPAPVQITAEQILREAKERTLPANASRAPKQKIVDKEELDEYKLIKRKQFEDAIRRNRTQIPLWMKYATWEESQLEYERYLLVWLWDGGMQWISVNVMHVDVDGCSFSSGSVSSRRPCPRFPIRVSQHPLPMLGRGVSLNGL